LKRVKSIDGVTLDTTLFISTEFDFDDYLGERAVAIDGSSVMFVQAKGAMTKEVQIYSKPETGWQSEEVKDALIDTVDELAKTIIYDDDTEDTFYYDHTKVPLQLEPIFNGALWYTVEINLLKG